MDDKDYSKKSDQDLQAERDKVAADLRSTPKNDPRHKELETRYNQIEAEQRTRAPKLNDQQRESFRPGEEPELRYLPPGSRLQKHADSDAVAQNKPMSPYWSSSESTTMKDGRHAAGANEVSGRYGGDPEKFQQHQRMNSAVSYDWNTKANQRVEVELKNGQYAYVGRANNMPYHKDNPNVTMMGGDYQTVAPGLKQEDYKIVDKGPVVAGNVEEQKKQNEAAAAERLNGSPRTPPSGGGGGSARRPPAGYTSPSPEPSTPEKGRSR